MSEKTEPALDRRQLERLLEFGRQLVSELDLEGVLRRVLDAARELTDARYAALGVMDGASNELERFLHVGIDPETADLIGPAPRGRGVLGELIRNPRPLRLDDVREHPRSYGYPTGHPEMTTFVGVPVMVRGEAWGNLYLTDKAGGEPFSAEDERVLVVLSEWAAVAIENARLYERAEDRRAELERAVHGLQATVSLGREVGDETDLERVLELVVKRGRALVDARAFVALLPGETGLRVGAVAGEAPESLVEREIDAAGSPVASVVEAGSSDRPGSSLRSGLGGLGIEATSMLLCALNHRGRREGVLAAFDRYDGAEFTADDELLLSMFATSAATAVAMVRAVEDEKLHMSISASENERRRWARELHDDTLQQLGAVKVMHETALLRGDEAVMRRSLERASEQLHETIASLEGLITELRPAALDQIGVAAALEALIDRAQATSGLRVSANVDLAFGDGEARLAPDLEATVYRLVQEALNNVIKHAGATEVRISMTEHDGELALTVTDDGQGFEIEQAPQRFGLIGMRERVLLAGGDLEIDSAPGAGTRLRAVLPLSYVDSNGGDGSGD